MGRVKTKKCVSSAATAKTIIIDIKVKKIAITHLELIHIENKFNLGQYAQHAFFTLQGNGKTQRH